MEVFIYVIIFYRYVIFELDGLESIMEKLEKGFIRCSGRIFKKLGWFCCY